MQTNLAVEQNKKHQMVRESVDSDSFSPVGKEKVYGGNDLPKSQVLSSQWNTERVREDANGDREDGEEEDDDELPCVIGESEGDFSQFCIAHAHKPLLPSFWSKLWHCQYIQRPRFPNREQYFGDQTDDVFTRRLWPLTIDPKSSTADVTCQTAYRIWNRAIRGD